MLKQKTLKESFSLRGKGLHTGPFKKKAQQCRASYKTYKTYII